MSRSPEKPKGPDWFQLAKKELEQISGLQFPLDKAAYDVAGVITEMEREFHGGLREIAFEFEGLRMFINYYFDTDKIRAKVMSIKSNEKKLEKEAYNYQMTIIQLACKLHLQNLANQTRSEVSYIIRPDLKDDHYLDLLSWAVHAGKQIFHWKQSYNARQPRRNANFYWAIIAPQKN